MSKFIVEEGEIEPQDFNRLRKSVGWEEHNFNDVFLSLKNTLYLVIAKNEKQEIIGMARIIGDQGMYFYIQDVIVLPKYQKQNVGFELMKKIMTYIEKNKYSVPLFVRTKYNERGEKKWENNNAGRPSARLRSFSRSCARQRPSSM